MAEHITSKVGEREFTLERIFAAPRKLVFRAFTEPEHVSRWWAPEMFTIPICRIDLRPGGIWHYCMESPEGERHWARAVYREIIEPERIVYIGGFADEEANPIEGQPVHLATVTFTEQDGKTKLTVRIEVGSAEELQAVLKMGMKEGLSMCVNEKLAKVLEEWQNA
ncbi:SRPBCC domain-containing protein [Camelliibacillus cellulosilyticus]|uniref:SRPBCC domain-containing protein n=1 Tax=Camelliibacillus cellulosilyticus TaxID=2174486 RepID=A0ABV9GLR3_9BACL